MQINGKQYNYSDISGLNDLKREARSDQNGALKEVAKQFESLFMNMMLKSMRDASMGDPIFDSNQSGMYRDMFDRQLALSMSQGRGMGLAEVLERQLSKQIPGMSDKDVTSSRSSAGYEHSSGPVKSVHSTNTPVGLVIQSKSESPRIVESMNITDEVSSKQEKFIRELWPMAEEAAAELDTLPEVLIAQAALETGWGKHISKDQSGSSHNLFNIKAGSDWDGEVVEKTTIEFYHGAPVKEVARFRAYDSYEDSFRDYVDFLKSSERYQPALRQAADPEKYIRGLHRAGYATDPAYADKILNIINREWDVINKTISLYEGMEINA
ncbi:MAG: flagellar assembly peptidoglycan hydrolase FlgJ [Gammaproteobacteria bacterium]|nr:flagellar assembly peptidoglycan hydrolase FlgJ [Gammaproteobacteria bacterium]